MDPMLIDTHAHIYLEAFESDLDAVLERARSAGVEKIVMPAIDVPSIRRAISLCERYEQLFAMAALHPSETKHALDTDFDAVAAACSSEYVVAIGETGLDYHWDRSFDERQQLFLRRHMRLAIERHLPIVFHNREAFQDLMQIVEEERATLDDVSALSGIFHCFTGTAAEAERVAEAGFYVGIGGILTFKNAGVDLRVRDIPLERIVLETDAPYLAPEPNRGARNEPAYVRLVAERLAAIKELSLEEVAEVTSRNAMGLFGLSGD